MGKMLLPNQKKSDLGITKNKRGIIHAAIPAKVTKPLLNRIYPKSKKILEKSGRLSKKLLPNLIYSGNP